MDREPSHPFIVSRMLSVSHLSFPPFSSGITGMPMENAVDLDVPNGVPIVFYPETRSLTLLGTDEPLGSVPPEIADDERAIAAAAAAAAAAVPVVDAEAEGGTGPLPRGDR